jgi:ADP-ribosylglycohydrolase
MTQDPSPLVGQGVADALGKAFETKPSDDPALLAWTGEMLPSEYHELQANQWTDDTMMARILAESIHLCGGFFPRDVADRYGHWLKVGPLRGMGTSTKKALGRLVNGTSWTESGSNGAEGNGTAMRAAPIGIFYHEDLDTAAEFARMDARITHLSIEAEEGSAAVAIGAALALNRTPFDELIFATVEHLKPSSVRSSLCRLTRVSGESVQELMQLFGTGAHVVETVPSAFSAFLHTGSYEGAVMAAIRAGGDTDTTAAITGALAGTYYGFASIPKEYKQGLEELHTLRRLERCLLKGPRTDSIWLLSP